MGMSQQEPFVAPGELMEDEFNIQLIISVICVNRVRTRRSENPGPVAGIGDARIMLNDGEEP